jgi:LysM repeat protein
VVGGQTINIAANLPNFEDDLVVGELVKVYVTLIEGELVGRDAELNPTDDEDEGDDDGGDYSCGDTPEGWTTYTVQSGDTLSGIAVRSDSDDDDLAEVNCIDDPSIIGIGDEILVPQEPEPQDVLDDDDLISEDEDEFDDDDDPVVDEEDESDDDDPVVDEEEDESDDDGDDDSEDEDESEDDDESDDDEEDSDEDE